MSASGPDQTVSTRNDVTAECLPSLLLFGGKFGYENKQKEDLSRGGSVRRRICTEEDLFGGGSVQRHPLPQQPHQGRDLSLVPYGLALVPPYGFADLPLSSLSESGG